MEILGMFAGLGIGLLVGIPLCLRFTRQIESFMTRIGADPVADWLIEKCSPKGVDHVGR